MKRAAAWPHGSCKLHPCGSNRIQPGVDAADGFAAYRKRRAGSDLCEILIQQVSVKNRAQVKDLAAAFFATFEMNFSTRPRAEGNEKLRHETAKDRSKSGQAMKYLVDVWTRQQSCSPVKG
jgi:hypothetical protein